MSEFDTNAQPLNGAGNPAMNLKIGGTSKDIDVKEGGLYRLWSTNSCYLRLQKGSQSQPATDKDMLVLANAPMIFQANNWDRMSAITLDGKDGVLGILRVQPPF